MYPIDKRYQLRFTVRSGNIAQQNALSIYSMGDRVANGVQGSGR
jgi:hypothetical protein